MPAKANHDTKGITPVFCLGNFGKKANDASFYIERLSTHLQTHTFVSKPHKHDFYLLLYIERGGGKHQIDFETYAVTPQRYFLMTPGQVHAWTLDAGTDGYILFFTPAFYRMRWSTSSLVEFPFFHALSPNPLVDTADSSVARIVEEMYAEFGDATTDTRIVRTYLDLLLLKLSRYYHTAATAVHADSFKIRKLEQLIDKHFVTLKQPSDYAELMHLSPSYLNSICKINVNKTLSAMIQERVTLEAKRLLAYTDLTTSEIAGQLHFSSASHFNRYFKKTTGSTPDVFKESIIGAI